MNIDLIHLLIVVLVILGAGYGLCQVTKPYPQTKEEYEKRLRKGSGIARGVMNASLYPFQEWLNPKAVEAIHVLKDMKAGHYDIRQENGDVFDTQGLVLPQIENRKERRSTGNHRTGVGGLLRRVLNIFRSR